MYVTIFSNIWYLEQTESMQLHHPLMATVANHHLVRQRALTLHMVTITIVMMEQVSEYYSCLSAESKQRCTDKITEVGLRKDPYAIPSKLGRQRLTRFQKWHGMICLYIWSLLQMLIPRKRSR